MYIKIETVRVDVEKISFMEYDPKGKWSHPDGKKGEGVASFVIDGVQLTVTDPVAGQIWKAYKWQTRGFTYIANTGEKEEWKREI